MKLFDTALNRYEPFTPDHLVGIYVCGITPYDAAHLGHIQTFMTYDLLQRRLEDLGHEVRLVRNVTDVDEPIYVKAKELGVAYTELATAETAALQDVLKRLHFRTAYAEPLASEYIDLMAAAVKQLLDRGFAYELEGDIYYDTVRFPSLTEFSNFNEKLISGFNAMRGGDPDRPGKRQALDFLLWKDVPDRADPARWESVLGTGRPGWHIECTVMSQATLGQPFDLHGGGTDLIFPHHSCEIAQSVGLDYGQPAKRWLHVSPLGYQGEKMSKSLGNLAFAKDILAEHEPSVLRLALMNYHHRIGGEWQPELLGDAKRLLTGIRAKLPNASAAQLAVVVADVRLALDNDLNTMEVIDALHRFAGQPAQGQGDEAHVKMLADLLGLDFKTVG